MLTIIIAVCADCFALFISRFVLKNQAKHQKGGPHCARLPKLSCHRNRGERCVCFASQNLSVPLQIVLRLDGIFAPKSMCSATDLQCSLKSRTNLSRDEGIVIDRRRWGSEILIKVTSTCLRRGKVTAVWHFSICQGRTATQIFAEQNNNPRQD